MTDIASEKKRTHKRVPEDGEASGVTGGDNSRAAGEPAILGSPTSRLDLLQKAAHAGFWAWTAADKKIWLSENSTKIWGLPEDRNSENAKFYLERVIEEDRERARAHFSAAMNSIADEYHDEFRIIHENGTIRWIDAVGAIERNEDGAPVSASGVMIDITDRRTVEEALRASQERLLLAQKAGGFGSWEYSAQSGRVQLSDSLWRILGEKPSARWVRIASLEKYIEEEDLEAARSHIIAAFVSRTGEFTYECRIRQRTGRIRYIEASGAIIRNEEGEPIRSHGTVADITEQKLISERVRDNEAELRLITNVIPALISYVDREERYRFVNDQYSRLFGVDKSSLVGRQLNSVLSPRSYKQLKPLIERAFAGESFSIHTWVTYKGVGDRFVNISYVPDLDAEKNVRGFYSFVNDLTELRRSEDALKFSRERMRVLTESFTDYAILSTDTEGLIDSWNPGAEKIFGYSESEILGKPSSILFTPEDNEKNVPVQEMAKARNEGRAGDHRWHLRKDGSRFFASGVLAPLYQNDTLTGYAKIAADLTEQMQYEADLQQARTELEARVASRTQALAETNAVLLKQMEERSRMEEQRLGLLRTLFTIQEDERGRIARDLHDQLGQRLTALRLKIASISTLCEPDSEMAERVQRLSEIAEMIDGEVSFLAWELRPTVLEETGFVTALANYAKEWSRYSGIETDLNTIAVSDITLDADVETNLYRITQEALNNTAKYAKATKVEIILERLGSDLMLIIEDDGEGFDVSEKTTGPEKGGFGLVGMRQRASLIGATFDVESSPGGGTTVFVRVPLVG